MADLIDRQAAIDEIDSYEVNAPDYMQAWAAKLIEAIKGDIRGLISELPSAQPDIIQCRNCKFASGDSRICMKFGHSPIGELDFCAWAERKEE